MSERVFVGLGANLGDPAARVREALDALDGPPTGRVVARSALYRSEPLGDPDQPWFVNAVAELRTPLEPRALLEALQALERAAGRPDPAGRGRWAPRALDLDLLLYGARRVSEPGLEVPHPAWRTRRFVLAPLAEIAPELPDPASGTPVGRLLADLDDPLRCERMCPNPGGAPAAGPTHPARPGAPGGRSR